MSGTERRFVPANYGADPAFKQSCEIHISFLHDERASLSLLFADLLENDD